MQPSSPENPLSTRLEALKQPLQGRRKLAWILFLLVLGLCLVLPVLFSLNQAPPEQALAPGKPPATGLDRMWNPGPLSTAHHQFANDCKACHSDPFKPVQDNDCKGCHANTANHFSHEALTQAGMKPARCASCHREHQGDFALLEQSRHFVGENCTDCHSKLPSVLPGTAVEAVSDFALGHPAFRVQTGEGADTRQRQQAGHPEALREQGGLKFAHDVHLRAKGLESPKGVVHLECSDCHVPTADGKSFQPITMKEQCQSCHALNFEPSMPGRQVPHGAPEEALAMLMEFYSFAALNPQAAAETAVDPLRLPPGRHSEAASEPAARRPNEQALAQAGEAAQRLFGENGCGVCHAVTAAEGKVDNSLSGSQLPQWHIAPVTATHAWMPKARFNHLAHRTAQCVDCHQADKSKSAEDVLMPEIGTCRGCHAGRQAEPGKVVSDCGLCHRFHPRGSAKVTPLGGAGREQP